MARALTIDLIQMPWSQSPATWKYHEPSVWRALVEATQHPNGSVHVQAQPSSNDTLSGELHLLGGSFEATVSIARSEASPAVSADHIAAWQAAAERYFTAAEASVYEEDTSVVTQVQGRLPEKEKGRVEDLLRLLWDQQLFALRISSGTLGEGDVAL